MDESPAAGGAGPEIAVPPGIDVKPCRDLARGHLEALFAPYGVEVRWAGEGADIPGSFWGEPEAGIIGDVLWLRPDTPVHSALHEGGHLVCAGAARRAEIHTDAGGDFAEEDAVCYLQILLADRLPGMGAARMMADMDEWGYTFRLGSARAWFEEDAEDALAGLEERGLAVDGELTAEHDFAATATPVAETTVETTVESMAPGRGA